MPLEAVGGWIPFSALTLISGCAPAVRIAAAIHSRSQIPDALNCEEKAIEEIMNCCVNFRDFGDTGRMRRNAGIKFERNFTTCDH